MKSETIDIRLTGVRPLLMHAGRLADPLDPVSRDLAQITGKRMKTAADHFEIARIEWHGGLWLKNGSPCIPAEALEACFIAGARSKRRGPQAQAGMLVEESALLRYEGPRDPTDLWEDESFRLRVPVRVGSARTMRTRAMFKDWSVDFTVSYLPTLLNATDILELFAVSGFTRGIGDWRPKFGRFTAQLLG